MKDTYKRGQWLSLCQRCGFKYMSSQLRLEWTKLRVCNNCFEYRQPQDFVKGIQERATPWARRPNETEIDPFQYVEAEYWDRDAVVPPATFVTDLYTAPFG